MSRSGTSRLPVLLRKHEHRLVEEWLKALRQVAGAGMVHAEAGEQARTVLSLLREAVEAGDQDVLEGPAWSRLREMLAEMSASRARQGFTPTETAVFVLSLKQPLFALIREEYANDPGGLADETWRATVLLDRLGLWTTEAFLKTREEVIARQQSELLELSTPVVSLWDGVLALPVIGTLDSERTQVVMENLLQRIVETGASIAIIDITGVPTVDTLVAQHLLKTVGAARLMGAECIISGIRPQIAQTIVNLGVDLGTVATKATLAAAFTLALARLGASISRPAPDA
jgi:rsbT co-antagonist protein RsbR